MIFRRATINPKCNIASGKDQFGLSQRFEEKRTDYVAKVISQFGEETKVTIPSNLGNPRSLNSFYGHCLRHIERRNRLHLGHLGDRRQQNWTVWFKQLHLNLSGDWLAVFNSFLAKRNAILFDYKVDINIFAKPVRNKLLKIMLLQSSLFHSEGKVKVTLTSK